MDVKPDLVVNELLSQIMTLSRERALYAALATQYQQELEAMKKGGTDGTTPNEG